jgi:hypothetical protein
MAFGPRPRRARSGFGALASSFGAAALAAASGCDGEVPVGGGRAAPALARVAGEGAALLPPASPGSVPCADGVSCPVTKAGRKVCCHAPGSPPLCRDGAKCGQNNGHRYDAMLACDETADCVGAEPGKDVVCCLSDDGAKARAEVPYNRGACVPRAACAAPSTLACRSDAECSGGRRCRPVAMAAGLSVGACLLASDIGLGAIAAALQLGPGRLLRANAPARG